MWSQGPKPFLLPHRHTNARNESNCCRSGHGVWVRWRKHDFLTLLVEWPGTAKTNCRESPASPTAHGMPAARCGGLGQAAAARGQGGRRCLPVGWQKEKRLSSTDLPGAEHVWESWGIVKQLFLKQQPVCFLLY